MLPVDMLRVDAAIPFSDILTVVAPMGLDLVFQERHGPSFASPARMLSSIRNLTVPDRENPKPSETSLRR